MRSLGSEHLRTDLGFSAVANPMARPIEVAPPPPAAVGELHRRLPGYERTPLLSLPRLAERLAVAELLVKCETTRLGLPAFKMLGASWATWRALCDHLGWAPEPIPWDGLEDLALRLKPFLPLTLAAATDGNHGRAVARMAHLLGLGACIFVPEGTTPGRMEAIRSEGAEVVVVPGSYDDAVARSAAEAGERCLVVSDTSWPGYTDVPRYVIEGYATMFGEIDEALARAGRPHPDVVVVPIGVGALAAAAVTHYRAAAHAHTAGAGRRPVLIGVEPAGAACVTVSAQVGAPTLVPGPHDSIMVGLNCGLPSPVAWPLVSRGFDGFVTIGDGWARDAVRDLACAGVEAGETGAAAVGGLAAARLDTAPPPLGEMVGPSSRVLCLVTEGASDPAGWRRIVGAELLG
ncbi:MAG: diaminopropionate ammonia-lyase [Acidimicrobiales bacterium]